MTQRGGEEKVDHVVEVETAMKMVLRDLSEGPMTAVARTRASATLQHGLEHLAQVPVMKRQRKSQAKSAATPPYLTAEAGVAGVEISFGPSGAETVWPPWPPPPLVDPVGAPVGRTDGQLTGDGEQPFPVRA